VPVPSDRGAQPAHGVVAPFRFRFRELPTLRLPRRRPASHFVAATYGVRRKARHSRSVMAKRHYRLVPLVALACFAVASAVTTSLGDAMKSPLARIPAPRELKVVSYYPADAGWTKMWTDWRPEVVAADLQRIASLHANTVRAVVQPGLFGYPHPSPTYASRLREFVSLAAQARLHVQLTLFDWWYDWSDLRGSRTWARELLAPYSGDPRVAFVELRNEIVVKRHTMSWARTMIPFIRALMRGRTPVTLSVTGTDPVRQLAALKRGLRSVRPDFFDIHYFGGGGELAASVLSRAKTVASPTPLWLGETGYPTTTSLSGYGRVPRTPQAQEAAQAHFLASVGWAAHANALPAAGVWTLTDFLPSALPDGRVKIPDAEFHYGLFRTDGSEKPAARVVRDTFCGRPPIVFNGSFEEMVAAEDGNLVPARWSMAGSDVAFADDATVARSGVASARLTPKAAGATASLSITPPNGAARAGQHVSVRAWARSSDEQGKALVVIEWFDRHNHLLRRSSSRPLQPASTAWSRLEVSARAPGRAAYLRIDLVAQHLTAAVWFDDVSFQKTRRARSGKRTRSSRARSRWRAPPASQSRCSPGRQD
jgi:hypothetical protein